jgi:oligoendopeptidase F
VSQATTDFVPAVLDATDWANVEPLLNALLDREVNSVEDLERWLLDRSETEAAIGEAGANTYINMTCDTGSEEKQTAYTSYIENVIPKFKPVNFMMDKKQKELAEKFNLTGGHYAVLHRDTAADVDLFRDENVSIETELAKLDQQYDKVCGAMTVEFDGEEKTLPMMGKYAVPSVSPRGGTLLPAECRIRSSSAASTTT